MKFKSQKLSRMARRQVYKFRALSRKQKIIRGVLLVAAVMIIIPVATLAYFARDLGSKDAIMNRRNTGVTLVDKHGTEFYHLYSAHTKSTVPIAQIPKNVQNALVATEDHDFYKHGGFSFKSIAAAFYADLRGKNLAYGGSTITQQLVKISLLNQSKSFLRKYQELFLAAEINRRYSKDEILEMYLNSVYFGEGAFGIEAASQAYFDKPASQLTLAEASQLIGILPAPSAYSPISGNKTAAKERQQLVLRKMTEEGYITAAEAAAAGSTELVYHPTPPADDNKAHHFALMVQDELIKKYGEEKVIRSGFRVTTTLDLSWQAQAETALSRQLHVLRGDHVSNGAVVAVDPKTGEIRALVGSVDWNNPQFGQTNMATSPRQPGSSFKPIVYSAAIQKHDITAATILQDVPTNFDGDYAPKDYDLKYRGDVTARRALANSLNIPAVEVIQKLGVKNAIAAARKEGITTLSDTRNYGLPLGLGTGEVKLTELTNAYASFADEGKQNPLTTIVSIENKQNKTIYKHKVKSKRVLDSGPSYIISSMLSDNQARAEEFGSALSINRTAAVKTGTTENFRDALTVGYTPNLAIGVWIGNNDNTPMDQVAGSLGPAPVWRSLMEKFSAGTPNEDFKMPFGVVSQNVCRSNGLKAGKTSSATYKEYFLRGTTPSGTCDTPILAQTPRPASTQTPEPAVTPNTGDQNAPTPSPSPTPIGTPTLQPATPKPTAVPIGQ